VAAGEDVLLVATRDILEGEEITRDYVQAPRLDGDTTEGSLRLLSQFGIAYI
jgi:SET domain-containing protein